MSQQVKTQKALIVMKETNLGAKGREPHNSHPYEAPLESGHCFLPETESISLSIRLAWASDKSLAHLVRLGHSEHNSLEEEHVLMD